MTGLLALTSMALLIAVGWLASAHRDQIRWRTVGGAFALQTAIGALVLYVPAGRAALESLSAGVSRVLAFAQDGINFVFGGIGGDAVGFVFVSGNTPESEGRDDLLTYRGIERVEINTFGDLSQGPNDDFDNDGLDNITEIIGNTEAGIDEFSDITRQTL